MIKHILKILPFCNFIISITALTFQITAYKKLSNKIDQNYHNIHLKK